MPYLRCKESSTQHRPEELQPVDRSGARWPGDGILGEHGRVFVVPSGDELLLYGVPALEDDEEK